MAERPHVRVDPAMRFGQPIVRGAPVDILGEMVWNGDTVDEVAAEYVVDRADVLVACWYLGLHGPKRWRKRWREWALKAHEQLWDTSTVDYRAVPDPPSRES
jgi:uncharacterized protein (DUF433 family)